MDAHALTIKTVRDGPICTLILRGDLDLLETGGFLEQGFPEHTALAVDERTHLPLRASLADPGASPLDGRGTP